MVAVAGPTFNNTVAWQEKAEMKADVEKKYIYIYFNVEIFKRSLYFFLHCIYLYLFHSVCIKLN